VYFLLTNIENSTKLWKSFPKHMGDSLIRHDEIISSSVQSKGGIIFKTSGDGIYTAFDNPNNCLEAALSIQDQIEREVWKLEIPIKVRIGLHSGPAEKRNGEYFGHTVSIASKVMESGHGSQILCTSEMLDHIQNSSKVSIKNLGEYLLKRAQKTIQIYQISREDQNFPPLRTSIQTANNLPKYLLNIVGRRTEIDQLIYHLTQQGERLLTIAGPGGIGKTRLAVEAAKEMLDYFTGGIYLIDLAEAQNMHDFHRTLAQTLGIPQTGGNIVERLQLLFSTEKYLLILDNFEQLIAIAPRIYDFLLGLKNLSLLITSRTVLNISGEYVFRLQPLETPQSNNFSTLGQYDAVTLFLERAKRADGKFELNNRNAALVAELCTFLEGIPLALELAASRLKKLSLDMVFSKLKDRLTLGEENEDLSDNGPIRYRTIRRTLDWSYESLDSDEKVLFLKLSIFPGSFSPEAAAYIADMDDDPLDLVGELCDKSLFQLRVERQFTLRYKALETIKDYGRNLLEQSELYDSLKDRFIQYYSDFAKQHFNKNEQNMRKSTLEELKGEVDSIILAIQFLIESQDIPAAREIVLHMQWYWYLLGDFRTMLQMIQISDKSTNVEQNLEIAIAKARALFGKGELIEAEDLLLNLDVFIPNGYSRHTINPLLIEGQIILGWIYKSMHKYKEAETCFLKAEDNTSSRVVSQRARFGIASSQLGLRDFAKVEKALTKLIDDGIQEKRLLAQILANLSVLYMMIESWEKAHTYLQEAEIIGEDYLDTINYIYLQVNKAYLADKIDHSEEEIEQLYQEVFEHCIQSKLPIYNALAKAFYIEYIVTNNKKVEFDKSEIQDMLNLAELTSQLEISSEIFYSVILYKYREGDFRGAKELFDSKKSQFPDVWMKKLENTLR
jgi:predicted ATPase/class 3 adenylate cyclase